MTGGGQDNDSPESEDWRSNDETQHSVTVASFYMAKFEVTQKEWQKKSSGRQDLTRWKSNLNILIRQIIIPS